MRGLIARRLLITVPVLFLVSLGVFSLIFLVPGDPAATLAGDHATPAQVDTIRAELGLDDPLAVQYWRWASAAITGDLGRSIFTGQPVTSAIAQGLPATLSLTLAAMVVTVLLGAPAGILAARFRDRLPDRLAGVAAAAGFALPGYFVGMLLVLLFANHLGWLPATRYVALSEDPAGWLTHLILPSIALGLAGAAMVMRQLRSALLGVLDQDYITMARVKGLRGHRIMLKHALKNAAIPVVTVLGNQIAVLLGGAVIIEQVFAIHGLGNVAISAVLRRDLPMIQGVVVFATVMVLAANLLVDIAYGYLNPKVRVA